MQARFATFQFGIVLCSHCYKDVSSLQEAMFVLVL